MGVTELIFELEAFMGVFSRLYCCHGNLLSHNINNNLFPNDRAVC